MEDGDTLTYSVESNTNPGLFSDIVIDNVAHTLTLTYAENQNGNADLIIRATDNGDGPSAALTLDQGFTVTVNPVNDVPVVENGGIPPVTVDEDAAPTVIDLASYFQDVEDGDTLTYSVESNTNPGLFSDVVIDNVAHTLTLTYAENQNGNADLIIRATDNGDGPSAALTLDQGFTVTVNPVNDVPVVENGGIPPVLVDEDAAPTVIDLASYFQDVEDGDTLTYSVESNTNPGLFSDVVIDNVAHTLTLTYAENQNGNADLIIRATDNGDGPSAALTLDQGFTVTVNPVNDAPLNSVPIVVQQTDPSGAVIFNDANGNLISISDVDAGTGLVKVTLTATHGTMTLNGVAGLSFDPLEVPGGQGTEQRTRQ